jgi:hypothetical protein
MVRLLSFSLQAMSEPVAAVFNGYERTCKTPQENGNIRKIFKTKAILERS